MIKSLNMLPSKYRISSDLRLVATIRGSPNIDHNKLNITFGVYAQVYIGTTNSTKQKTLVGIAIRPAD